MTTARRHMVPRGRRLLLEQLEQRLPLTGWQNAFDRLDVNDDGMVAPVDVLILVNRQNAEGSGPLKGQAVKDDPLVDVNGNSLFEPSDVLVVVNALNQTGPLPPRKVNIPLTTDSGVQQMPSVAIDPNDADNVVVAYMDYSLLDTGYAGLAVAVSRNGGTSWTSRPLPLPAGFDQGAANPIAKFDDQGRVYVSYSAVTFLEGLPGLTNPFATDLEEAPRRYGFRANNGVFVVHSSDGGINWDNPVAVVSNHYEGESNVNFDLNPEIAVDVVRHLPDGNWNPHYGNLYVTWTRAFPPGQFPGEPNSTGGLDAMIAISKDHGQSWETKLEVRDGLERTVIQIQRDFDPNTGLGNDPGYGFMDQVHVAVGAEGEVYVSHFGGGNHALNVSRDGGESFSEPDIFTGEQIVFGTGFTSYVSADGLPGNMFRTLAVRAIAADPTRPGTAYAAEVISVVNSLGEEVDPADVYFGRSEDYGVTWSTTFTVGNYPDSEELPSDGFFVPINDDNHAQSPTDSSPGEVVSGQALVRLVTDNNGRVALIWYDTRRDPENIKLDVFGAISLDGGRTFGANFRLTDISFDAHNGSFLNAIGDEEFYLGDAIGLALQDDVGFAAWTDTRHGNQDIYLRRIATDAPPEPLNDRFEPNDTPDLNSSPTVLGRVVKRTVPKLMLTSGDQDYFLLESAATGELLVEAQVSGAPSTIGRSMQLELYDETGESLLRGGQGVFDGDGNLVAREIRYPAAAGERFQVRVFVTDEETVEYTLKLQSLTGDLGQRVYALLEGMVTSHAELIYSVTAAAAGSVEVVMNRNPETTGEVVLAIADPVTLESLSIGLADSDNRILATLQVQEGQELLLRITANSIATGDYSLEFSNLDQFSQDGRKLLFFPVGGGTSQASIADVNADGHLDILVTSALSDRVNVLLGNGDGTFEVPRTFTIGAFNTANTDITARVPTFGRDVVVADLNGDGTQDIVVNNFASSDVSVLLGRGDGTFAPQRREATTPAPFDLDVGDVNNDGIVDIAVIETATGKTQVALSVLLGRGDGTFLPQRVTHVPIGGNNNGTLRLADLNGDGKLDAVVSGDGAVAQVSIFLGIGDGYFEFSTNLAASRLAVGLDVEDINGDGRPDIANAGFGGVLDVVVLLQNSDGTYAVPLSVSTPVFPTGLDIIDFGSEMTLADGSKALGPPDGVKDILIAAAGLPNTGGPTGAPYFSVIPGVLDSQGDYTLGQRLNVVELEAPRDIDAADVNHDGLADAVLVEPNGVVVVFNEPPNITPNDTPATARDLGTVVHLVDQTQTIVPDRQNAYYKFTVPTEAVTAADEVVDVSLLFQYTEGDGIGAELLDAQGNLLGSGDRFRVLAAQGEELTLHVFGVNGGSGAFTPVINVLPQVVAIEAQALLPGVGLNPGGPTTSIVVTLQGDRLDPDSAQNPANFTVTSFGPDRLFGTADDRVIPIQEIVYSPGTNVSISSGRTFPTAVRQTITLSTDEPLPTGSYRVDLSANIRTEDFNDQEAGLLADKAGLVGHPVVSLESGRITEGSRQVATGLVLPATSVGDLGVFTMGTGFLTQLHADLAAQLDATLSDVGDDAQVTDNLLALLTERLVPTVGPSGQRITSIIAIWLDPVDLLFDIYDQQIVYQQAAGTVTNETDQCFVEVGGNIEVIVCPLFNPVDEMVTLDVSLVSDVSRGGALQITTDEVMITSLTDPMRAGQTRFEFLY